MDRWLALAVAVTCAMSGCLAVRGESPQQSVGAALLRTDLYPGLVIEVAAVAGREPDAAALRDVVATIGGLTGRTTVNLVATVPIPAQGGDYSGADLLAIHRRTARVVDPAEPLRDGRVGLHVLYLDGALAKSSDGDLVLGSSAQESGVIAVFRDAYSKAYRLVDGEKVPAAAEMDRHVLLHELGHLLGLVNLGLPMVRDHEDPDHPGHSSDPYSVMRHQAPMNHDQLVFGPATRFDADDLADVAAARKALGLPTPVIRPT